MFYPIASFLMIIFLLSRTKMDTNSDERHVQYTQRRIDTVGEDHNDNEKKNK